MHKNTHPHTHTNVIFQKEIPNLTFSYLLSMKPHVLVLAQHLRTLRCHNEESDMTGMEGQGPFCKPASQVACHAGKACPAGGFWTVFGPVNAVQGPKRTISEFGDPNETTQQVQGPRVQFTLNKTNRLPIIFKKQQGHQLLYHFEEEASKLIQKV